MKEWVRSFGAWMATAALGLPGAQPSFAQSSGQDSSGHSSGVQATTTQEGGYVLKVNGELVLTNVVARDTKTGEVVLGLKRSDFSIYENGKQQQIDTFDFESVRSE